MAAPSSSAPSSSTALLRHPLSCASLRPPAEDLGNSWILEFVLRQPIPDSLAHEIFLSLPFSSPELHPHLRKTLLLRRLSSDLSRRSISERTLHSLELIEELDRLCGTTSSNRMKEAYCAAAVECTASAYRMGAGDFRDTVERIWMTRIFNLMRSEASAGLVSEPLVQLWKRMGHYLFSGDGSEELLKKDVENTMRLVKDYVDEAVEEMGPSFLEIAVAELVENRMDLNVGVDKTGKDVIEVNGSFAKLDEKPKELEDYGVVDKVRGLTDVSMGVLQEGEVRHRSGDSSDTSLKDLEDDRARGDYVGLDDALTDLGKDDHFVVGSSQNIVEMEIDNRRVENVNGNDKNNHNECISRRVDSNEVSKVKKALKKSCFDLNMVVEDPLPEAQAVAAAVLASMSQDCVLPSENAMQSSAEKSSDLNLVEENHVGKEYIKDVGTIKSSSVVSSGAIFERNPTAHTLEWSDDSISSFEKSLAPNDNLKSPNPMTRRICSPRLDEGKLVRRRAVKRWTSQEEDKLREAVAKYGKGNWKLILNNYSKIFGERTEVDLKDKWRNLCRSL